MKQALVLTATSWVHQPVFPSLLTQSHATAVLILHLNISCSAHLGPGQSVLKLVSPHAEAVGYAQLAGRGGPQLTSGSLHLPV